MNEQDKKEIHVDILKHVEGLSQKINNMMAPRTQAVLARYPITFGVLILFGVISLHEGLKGLMKEFGFLDINPWYPFIIGLVILIITGTLYKKLDDK